MWALAMRGHGQRAGGEQPVPITQTVDYAALNAAVVGFYDRQGA
jgi:hypothetical protein